MGVTLSEKREKLVDKLTVMEQWDSKLKKNTMEMV